MGTKYIIDVGEYTGEDDVANAKIYVQDDNEPSSELKDDTNKRPYSFYVSDVSNIERWRAYFDITGVKVGEFITTAINEHIRRNPPTLEQKTAFNERMLGKINKF
jgi:hypothetical protein